MKNPSLIKSVMFILPLSLFVMDMDSAMAACPGGGSPIPAYSDADGDGYFGTFVGNMCPDAIDDNPALSAVNDDCDDTDDEIYPGASEFAHDGIDQDCDGGDDCYQDLDGDGYGSVVVISSADLDCSDSGESDLGGDCDDSKFMVHPNRPENPLTPWDDNCNGSYTSFAPRAPLTLATQNHQTGILTALTEAVTAAAAWVGITL